MPESRCHMDLVKIIIDYVNSIICDDERCFVAVDTPDSADKPDRLMDNYSPDLLLKTSEKLIIGEAKTDTDAEKQHSKLQYKSYINECKAFNGMSLLVVCVELYEYNFIKNLLRNLKSDAEYTGKIVVLNSVGGRCEI